MPKIERSSPEQENKHVTAMQLNTMSTSQTAVEIFLEGKGGGHG